MLINPRKLIEFSPNRITKSYWEIVTRYSTLYPISGYLNKLEIKSYQDLFIALSAKLNTTIKTWRSRLFNLQKYNWVDLVSKIKYYAMLNCYPGILSCQPITAYCRQSVCPWCHGRTVVDVYKRSCEVISKYKDNYKLLLFETTIYPDSSLKIRHVFDHGVNTKKSILKNIINFGGYTGISVEPYYSAWKYRLFGVLLVDKLYKVENDGSIIIRELSGNNKIVLATHIGNTMRYATSIVKCQDIDKVVTLLHSRKNRRLLDKHGIFRNKNE